MTQGGRLATQGDTGTLVTPGDSGRYVGDSGRLREVGWRLQVILEIRLHYGTLNYGRWEDGTVREVKTEGISGIFCEDEASFLDVSAGSYNTVATFRPFHHVVWLHHHPYHIAGDWDRRLQIWWP